jgi:glycosyltransferase involved in cell wall biosynthesis
LSITETSLRKGKFKFILVGSYHERKGQDILVKALELLPKEAIEKSEFIFIGDILDKEIYEKVKKYSNRNNNCSILEPISRKELLKLYDDVDCFLCTSKDDPMPVVLTEAMAMKKICICSENTGTAKYITDGSNGFVYKNNDPKELALKIMFVVDNLDKIEDLKELSYNIFLKNFHIDIFRKNLLTIIENMVK